MKWYGKSTKGLNRAFKNKVVAAAVAKGAVGIYVYSAKRTRENNTGVSNSNHLYGRALDGYAIMEDGSKIPLGTLLKDTAGQYGLRSGDQPGFYKGGPDPNHVDDGYNVGGVTQTGTPPQTQTPPAQPDGTTQTVSDTGYDVSGQLTSAIRAIPQTPSPPLSRPPLAGEPSNTEITPQYVGETWQLIASQGDVSPDTIRLAQLASYGDGTAQG